MRRRLLLGLGVLSLLGLLAFFAWRRSVVPAHRPILEAALPELQQRDRELGDFLARYHYRLSGAGASRQPGVPPTSDHFGELRVARRGRYVRFTWDFMAARPAMAGIQMVSQNSECFIYRDLVLHGYLSGHRYEVVDPDSIEGQHGAAVDVFPPLDLDLGYQGRVSRILPPEDVARHYRDEEVLMEATEAWSDVYVGKTAKAGTWGEARYAEKRSYLWNSTKRQSHQYGWHLRLANGKERFVPSYVLEVLSWRNGFASRVRMKHSDKRPWGALTNTSTMAEVTEAIRQQEAGLYRFAEFQLLEVIPLPPHEKVTVMDSIRDIEEIRLHHSMASRTPAYVYDTKARDFIFSVRYDEETGEWILLDGPIRVPRKGRALFQLPRGVAGDAAMYAD